jgi:hypothetical protein
MILMTMPPALRRPAAVALAMFLCLPAAGLRAQTPSLVDLAKEEQQRRKTVKAGSKVYSDADLRQVIEAVPPGAAALPPPTEQKPAQKPEKKDENEKDEAWWRARMTQAREAQRRGEVFAEALQSQINVLSADAVNRDDPFQRAKVGQDRQKAAGELVRVMSEIEKAKKDIAAIEEEARQANAPPGWLR